MLNFELNRNSRKWTNIYDYNVRGLPYDKCIEYFKDQIVFQNTDHYYTRKLEFVANFLILYITGYVIINPASVDMLERYKKHELCIYKIVQFVALTKLK